MSNSDDIAHEEARGTVPYSRLAQVISERNALRSQIGEFESQVAQLQQGYASQLDALKAQAAEQVKTIAANHQQDLSLVEHGIRDPLGRQVVRQAWEQAPRDARGKSPAEWWGQQVKALEAHRADPDSAPAPEIPRALLGYVTPTDAPAVTSAPALNVDAGARPRTVKGIGDIDVSNMGMTDFLAALANAG